MHNRTYDLLIYGERPLLVNINEQALARNTS